MFRSFLLAVLFAGLVACRESGDHSVAEVSADSVEMSVGRSAGLAPARMSKSAPVARKEGSKYLAYTHSVSAKLERDVLRATYDKLLDACNTDESFGCVVVNSHLNKGDSYANANLRFRVKAEGVEPLLSIVSAVGELESQSTSADDLAVSVADNAKRLEMLTSYRARLQELELKASNNIESMIKIASELSKVQSQIEAAEGHKRNLFSRINKDYLNVRLHSDSEKSWWTPIKNAFKNLSGDFARAIALLVQFFAYAVFWLPALFIALFFLRFVWKKVFKAS